MLKRQEKRIKRHKMVRAKIKGTAKVPRLCVFRSNKHIYGQLIDDSKEKTLLVASDYEIKKSELKKSETISKSKIQKEEGKLKKREEREVIRAGKVAVAYEVGKLIAKKAVEKKIKKIVFDRAGYKYYGKVKALAEGAREGGLQF